MVPVFQIKTLEQILWSQILTVSPDGLFLTSVSLPVLKQKSKRNYTAIYVKKSLD